MAIRAMTMPTPWIQFIRSRSSNMARKIVTSGKRPVRGRTMETSPPFRSDRRSARLPTLAFETCVSRQLDANRHEKLAHDVQIHLDAHAGFFGKAAHSLGIALESLH